MAGAAGYAVLPTTISLSGINKELQSQLLAPASKAAKQAGDSIEKGIQAGADDAAKRVEKANYRVKRSSEELADAEAKRSAEVLKSQAAAKQLEAAESKLSEMKKSGKASSEQLARAEADVLNKRARVETTAQNVEKAEQGVEKAMTESKRAAESLEKAERDLASASDDASDKSRQLSKAVDDADDSFGRMEVGVGAVAGVVGGVFASVAQAAIGSMGELVSGAMDASDATDKFKQTLDFAGLDTSAIDQATAAAQEYADRTVYELGDIQSMTAQLAANGVKDYTGLAEAAGNLNAVAGGNAETFKSVGMVMTQTAGAGKLTTENWNQLADAVPGASGKLQEALESAGAYTGNFRDAMADGQITAEEFNDAVMKLGNEPIAQEAAQSTETFEGMLGNLQATVEGGLAQAFSEAKPQIESLVGFFASMAETAIPAFVGAVSGAVDAIQGFAEWVQKSKDWLLPLGTGLTVVAGGLAAVALQQNILAAGGLISWFSKLTAVTKIQTAATAAFNLVMNANPIMLVVTAIAALVAGLVVFFTKTETGRAMWESFTTAIGEGWTWLTETLSAGWEWIKTTVFDGWTATVDGIRGAWQSTVDAITGAWTWLSETLTAGWEFIKTAVFLAWNAEVEGWKNIFTTAKDAVGSAWTFLKDMFVAVWNTIKTLVFQAWNREVEGWKNIFESAKNGINSAWDSIKGKASEAVGAVRGKLQDMVSAIAQIPGKVKNVFSDAGSWLVNAGKNIISGLINGIKSMFGQVGNAIGSVLPDRIRGMLGFTDGGLVLVDGGITRSYLDGGIDKLERYANGGDREDHRAQIARGGEWRVWAEPETGGESYIPLAKSKRKRSTEVLAKTADIFGLTVLDKDGERISPAPYSAVAPMRAQYFAEGGITAKDLRKFAEGGRVNGYQASRSLEGAPYVFGGSNWGDCSGTASAFAALAVGQNPFPRKFATVDEAQWLSSNGFKSGRGKQGDLRIGFKNGGPGGGHTASTLPDGTNVEMGGGRGNGQIGGQAAGAWDSYFDTFFYKTIKPPEPPKMNKILDQNAIPDGASMTIDGVPVSVSADETTGTGENTVTVALSPEDAAKATAAKELGDQSILDFAVDGIFDMLGMRDSVLKKLLTTKGNDFLPNGDSIVTTQQVKEQPRTNVAAKNAQAIESDAVASMSESQIAKDPQLAAPKPAKLEGPDWGPEFFAGEIARKAKDMGLDKLAAKIGLAAALVESGSPLKMWANLAVPESLNFRHDAIGSDYDSVGLFQQRDNGAWGTVKERMTPYDSAGMFFDKLKSFDYHAMDPGAAAQKVQVSAFPSRYATQMGNAESLLDKVGVFDQGGWLKPGGIAANLSNEPEPVFNGDQWRDIKRGGLKSDDGMTLVVNLEGQEVLRKRVDKVEDEVTINTEEISKLRRRTGVAVAATTRGGAM